MTVRILVIYIYAQDDPGLVVDRLMHGPEEIEESTSTIHTDEQYSRIQEKFLFYYIN